jgi:arginyl-tRNA synthetase
LENEPEVLSYEKMNSWVYSGFDVTYKRMAVILQKHYESETYLPGKKFVEEGLKQGVFFKKEDGVYGLITTDEGLMKNW